MQFLTPAQAAKSLGISRSRIYRLIGAGKLPAQRVGSVWLIRPSSLRAARNRKPGRPKRTAQS